MFVCLKLFYVVFRRFWWFLILSMLLVCVFQARHFDVFSKFA